jgi:hypothetical protein
MVERAALGRGWRRGDRRLAKGLLLGGRAGFLHLGRLGPERFAFGCGGRRQGGRRVAPGRGRIRQPAGRMRIAGLVGAEMEARHVRGDAAFAAGCLQRALGLEQALQLVTAGLGLLLVLILEGLVVGHRQRLNRSWITG